MRIGHRSLRLLRNLRGHLRTLRIRILLRSLALWVRNGLPLDLPLLNSDRLLPHRIRDVRLGLRIGNRLRTLLALGIRRLLSGLRLPGLCLRVRCLLAGLALRVRCLLPLRIPLLRDLLSRLSRLSGLSCLSLLPRLRHVRLQPRAGLKNLGSSAIRRGNPALRGRLSESKQSGRQAEPNSAPHAGPKGC